MYTLMQLSSMSSMNKKTVIITGASSGLGKEYLNQLLNDPSIEEYWIIARRKELLEELSKKDIRIISLPLDLTNKHDIQTLIDTLDQKKPDIKILINAAGMGKVAMCDEITNIDTERIIDLNCKALALITQITLPFMKKGSRIIQIASIAGFQPMPGFALYAASKAFVQSYTKALHYELRPKGIKVTAVCPYWISDTQFISITKEYSNQSYQKRPFSTNSEKVVQKSLEDSLKNKWISTPDPVSTFDRIVTKILPDSIVVPIMDLVRKI